MVLQLFKIHLGEMPKLKDEIDKRRPFRPLRYDSKEVSRMIARRARDVVNTMPNTLQRLMDIAELSPPTHKDLRKTMQKAYTLLDGLFFWSALEPAGVRVRWLLQIPDRKRATGAYDADTAPAMRSPRNLGKMRILLVKSKDLDVKEAVQTLLHEMLHAFLDVYSCCCPLRCLWKRYEGRRQGITGHGADWCRAAIPIAGVLSLLWGVDVHLGIAEGMRREEWRSGWRPRGRQMRKWRRGLEPSRYASVDVARAPVGIAQAESPSLVPLPLRIPVRVPVTRQAEFRRSVHEFEEQRRRARSEMRAQLDAQEMAGEQAHEEEGVDEVRSEWEDEVPEEEWEDEVPGNWEDDEIWEGRHQDSEDGEYTSTRWRNPWTGSDFSTRVPRY